MTNRRAVGSRYEEEAARFLQSRGLRILERNYHSRYGELDIIAETPDGTIAAVEVKYRKSMAYGDPAEAVDFRKQLRMARSLQCYVMQHGLHDRDLRFDVIAICGTEGPRWIPNAFMMNM